MTLKSLWTQVKNGGRDEFRNSTPFSEEVQLAHQILLQPYFFAKEHEREEALVKWLRKFQPCLFGRMAANRDELYTCILHEDVLDDEAAFADQLKAARLKWKQWAAHPRPGVPSKHGFMLLLTGNHLANARLSRPLQTLAEKVLEIWGSDSIKTSAGDVDFETLYIKEPTGPGYRRFKFSIDFFLAQGDGRWFADHRVPGGLAFTANSVGHMRYHREHYQSLGNQTDWMLKTAMQTIEKAADTKWGKSTRLVPLEASGQARKKHPCPFSTGQPSGSLQGQDWTIYHGYHHTDHAVRPAFFESETEMPVTVRKSVFIEDFSYLYDQNLQDNLNFVRGIEVTRDQVVAELGDPNEWPSEPTPTSYIRSGPQIGSEEYDSARKVIDEALKVIRRDWNLES